jgi:hypothetical protein
MRTRFFNWLLPLAVLLLTQCSNPDGTDSFRDSMDDREEDHTDYRRQDRDTADSVGNGDQSNQ